MKRMIDLLTGFVLATSVLAGSAQAATTVTYPNYTLTKGADGIVRITASNGASWTGYIATPGGQEMPIGTKKHSMQFEFVSPNYFVTGNSGHFAMGIRGDGVTDFDRDGVSDFRGRGVIIGSVNAYPAGAGGCGPSSQPNVVAIESFWVGGNCVFGYTESPVLTNNRRYKLNLWSKDASANELGRLVGYTLWLQVGSAWYMVNSKEIYDSAPNTSPGDLGGWFFGEVYSGHQWTMQLQNVIETFE